jgi:hypothetical protein
VKHTWKNTEKTHVFRWRFSSDPCEMWKNRLWARTSPLARPLKRRFIFWEYGSNRDFIGI